MALDAILEKNRDRIIKKWFDYAVNTYPLDTSRFLKTQANEFANPVGSMLSKGMAVMFDELVKKEPDREKIMPVLDPIARVRAIQDFSSSDALSFILHLKPIVRETAKKEGKSGKVKDEELIDYYRKVDNLLLLGFDIYVACREKIFELKANEEKNKVYKAFRRAGLIKESLDDDSEPHGTNCIND